MQNTQLVGFELIAFYSTFHSKQNIACRWKKFFKFDIFLIETRLRILLWIVCIVLACYHHLNTELESGPHSFVSLVTVVAFPISMFVFDNLMLVINDDI